MYFLERGTWVPWCFESNMHYFTWKLSLHTNQIVIPMLKYKQGHQLFIVRKKVLQFCNCINYFRTRKLRVSLFNLIFNIVQWILNQLSLCNKNYVIRISELQKKIIKISSDSVVCIPNLVSCLCCLNLMSNQKSSIWRSVNKVGLCWLLI